MRKEIRDKIKSIKLVATDVDGTLTDGGMYYTTKGDIMKKFHVRDGMGVNLLKRRNISTVLITKEMNPINKRWAKNMNIKKVYEGIKEKEKLVKQLCNQFKIKPEEICYIGDDVNDIELIKNVGLSACPVDADNNVKKNSDIILTTKGGKGVLREIVNLILAVKFSKEKKIY
ncbi:MAG: 3-deoxy-D-manno-octulosonate 8-phosphate phosphatase [Nitrospina sp.]|nr:3-deoxy-D-manno-octulosonate 8-phosphate phosphatase [Nitrospina sp.]|tara:strand:- start:5162 stop:5677 length:516 start_codon:yes stop_codon:yes gene_type:complete